MCGLDSVSTRHFFHSQETIGRCGYGIAFWGLYRCDCNIWSGERCVCESQSFELDFIETLVHSQETFVCEIIIFWAGFHSREHSRYNTIFSLWYLLCDMYHHKVDSISLFASG